jgi:L-fucose mutarotase
MPLKGVPDVITPEFLFAIARMGHGDSIVIADANFPSDSVAKSTIVGVPIRVYGSTHSVLQAMLVLFPLDNYSINKIGVMDMVPADKERGLVVPAYDLLAAAAGIDARDVTKIERFEFYEAAKKAFVIIQTDDKSLYANCIVSKGVL